MILGDDKKIDQVYLFFICLHVSYTIQPVLYRIRYVPLRIEPVLLVKQEVRSGRS